MRVGLARRSGELCEADGVLVEREGGVDVLHERVAEEPDVAAEADVLAHERADALAGAALGLAQVEADERRRDQNQNCIACAKDETRDSLGGGDLPVLAAPGERDGGGLLAGEVVEALVGVVHARAGDSGVELLDRRGRAVHDRGARVDDGLELADDGLAVHVRLRAGDLPEAGRGVDLVVLNRARVELVVRAAEVELGALGGELEGEFARFNAALVDGRLEEGVLLEWVSGRTRKSSSTET